ncbi:type I restriction enzyme HsdR N-terminal domain-containing protein [Delftia acidovorans]|nr:type I restriction enzyme HsdR N-terminal domain-containing protein [Delftia acidovorans]
MEAFKQRVLAHTEHIKKVSEFCTTEETTKQALILPLLDILGFSAFDPTKVRAEHIADFPGAKAGERVDYALFSNGLPVMFIEAKACSQNLNNHCPQLSRYYNATPEVAISAITNGREWRFFTDLVNKNIMDDKPFLTLHLDKPTDDAAEQLLRFHHDQFQPDALRALAEESIYLSAFRDTIGDILKECDTDFVRYVAGRANIQRTFTARFLEQMQPIVKQALAHSVSALVATSLNKTPDPAPDPVILAEIQDPDAPIVDPINPKIVTTANERKLFDTIADLLPGEDLQGRDTESYYAVLYQGKTNRWLVRYWGDKKTPTVQFGITLSAAHKEEINRARMTMGAGDTVVLEKPENLLRLAGIINDTLLFCKNDENFKRKSE